jgi:hypothetical protein
MSKEIVKISPEGVEIANAYLEMGNIAGVCSMLAVSRDKVVSLLNTREVKKYIDTVYLDTGYRNRTNIGGLLDHMIKSKLEEAEESGVYSSKDLADLLQMAHKMRIEEIKLQQAGDKEETIKNQTNVQINEALPFGQGNYGKLLEKLVNGGTT